MHALRRSRTPPRYAPIASGPGPCPPPLSLRLRQRPAAPRAAYVDREGLTQTEAAERLGVSQPRVNDLVGEETDRFTIGALLSDGARHAETTRATVRARWRDGRVQI